MRIAAGLYLVWAFVVCLISMQAAIEVATDRGRTAWWGAAGFLVPVVTPFLLWLMPPSAKVYDRCEFCTEHIRPRAVVCPYCSREVVGVRHSVDA